ncbi:MAG: hypothetical protein AAF433_20555 [Bacteroidota bacterium]
MKTLRNFLLLFALAFTVNTASAQLSVGPVATLGFNFDEIGIGARGTYDINDQFRPAADFIFYLVDGGTVIGFNANLHYKFAGETGGVQPYVLAGLGFVSFSVDTGFGNVSVSDTGLNLGGGVTLPLGNATFFGEGIFGVGGSELGLLAGILFNL